MITFRTIPLLYVFLFVCSVANGESENVNDEDPSTTTSISNEEPETVTNNPPLKYQRGKYKRLRPPPFNYEGNIPVAVVYDKVIDRNSRTEKLVNNPEQSIIPNAAAFVKKEFSITTDNGESGNKNEQSQSYSSVAKSSSVKYKYNHPPAFEIQKDIPVEVVYDNDADKVSLKTEAKAETNNSISESRKLAESTSENSGVKIITNVANSDRAIAAEKDTIENVFTAKIDPKQTSNVENISTVETVLKKDDVLIGTENTKSVNERRRFFRKSLQPKRKYNNSPTFNSDQNIPVVVKFDSDKDKVSRDIEPNIGITESNNRYLSTNVNEDISATTEDDFKSYNNNKYKAIVYDKVIDRQDSSEKVIQRKVNRENISVTETDIKKDDIAIISGNIKEDNEQSEIRRPLRKRFRLKPRLNPTSGLQKSENEKVPVIVDNDKITERVEPIIASKTASVTSSVEGTLINDEVTIKQEAIITKPNTESETTKAALLEIKKETTNETQIITKENNDDKFVDDIKKPQPKHLQLQYKIPVSVVYDEPIKLRSRGVVTRVMKKIIKPQNGPFYIVKDLATPTTTTVNTNLDKESATSSAFATFGKKIQAGINKNQENNSFEGKNKFRTTTSTKTNLANIDSSIASTISYADTVVERKALLFTETNADINAKKILNAPVQSKKNIRVRGPVTSTKFDNQLFPINELQSKTLPGNIEENKNKQTVDSTTSSIGILRRKSQVGTESSLEIDAKKVTGAVDQNKKSTTSLRDSIVTTLKPDFKTKITNRNLNRQTVVSTTGSVETLRRKSQAGIETNLDITAKKTTNIVGQSENSTRQRDLIVSTPKPEHKTSTSTEAINGQTYVPTISSAGTLRRKSQMMNAKKTTDDITQIEKNTRQQDAVAVTLKSENKIFVKNELNTETSAKTRDGNTNRQTVAPTLISSAEILGRKSQGGTKLNLEINAKKTKDDVNQSRKNTRQRDPVVPILKSENKLFAQNGEFAYSYEGGDGTKAFSNGVLKSFEEDRAGEAVVGGFSYKDKEGNDFSLSYTADENGYRPVGAHLPTPPPIPPAIARALAYLATKTTPEPVTEASH